MNIKAAIIAGPRQLRIEEVPRPAPGPGQVLIKLSGCGVCASNLPLWEGREWFKYPLEPGAPGHEGWGKIEEVGDEIHNLKKGQLVAFVSSNAYAEYDVASPNSVLPLPKPLENLPLALEPLACVMNIFARSKIEAYETVAIVGAGFIGLNLCQLIAGKAKRLIILSRRKNPSEIFKGTRSTWIDLSDVPHAVDQVHELTNGRGCDCVIETGGYQTTLDTASDIVCERGRLVIAGYHQDGPRQVNMQVWNWKGLDVINAHDHEPRLYLEGMNAALRAIGAGQLDPWHLFTHKVMLDRIGDAFELMINRPDKFVKAWVQI